MQSHKTETGVGDAMGGAGQAGAVRALIGALVAPLGTLLVWVIFEFAKNFNLARHAGLSGSPFGLLWTFEFHLHQVFSPMTLFVAYAGELVVWIPVHLYLQRHGLTSLRIYILAGVLSLVVLFAVPWFVVGGPMGVLLAIGTMPPLGMIWSTIFWTIARPDLFLTPLDTEP